MSVAANHATIFTVAILNDENVYVYAHVYTHIQLQALRHDAAGSPENIIQYVVNRNNSCSSVAIICLVGVVEILEIPPSGRAICMRPQNKFRPIHIRRSLQLECVLLLFS